MVLNQQAFLLDLGNELVSVIDHELRVQLHLLPYHPSSLKRYLLHQLLPRILLPVKYRFDLLSHLKLTRLLVVLPQFLFVQHGASYLIHSLNLFYFVDDPLYRKSKYQYHFLWHNDKHQLIRNLDLGSFYL